MSNVTFFIGGRSYVIACDEGQERHVTALGRMIDEKLGSMPGHEGLNEQRSLLFAAILLADEIHELKRGGAASPALAQPIPAPEADSLTAPQLESLAERLENLAGSLERQAVRA